MKAQAKTLFDKEIIASALITSGNDSWFNQPVAVSDEARLSTCTWINLKKLVPILSELT